MKIYYSNMASQKSKLFPPIGVLISYFGLKKIKLPKFCNSLFLDSGAFSSWRLKKDISLKFYIDFLHQNKKLIDVYCSLDNILSFQKSLDNFKEMRKEGLEPLPCFHYGEPHFILEYYLQHTSYVALGGIAKKNKKERIWWLDEIFNRYPNVNYHGFGIQDRDILNRYPWYSVDSSSAHVMARFGGICTPWGDFKINPEVKKENLSWITPKIEQIIKEWVISLGVNYSLAKGNNGLGTELRCLINIFYYESLSQKKDFKKEFRKKGFLIN